MGARLQNEHVGHQGEKWRMTIYDSSYSSSVIPFYSNGFKLLYKGEGEPLYNPLRPSDLSFIIVNTDANIQSFLDDLIAAHEEQMLIKIELWQLDYEPYAYRLWWAGVLIHDILTIPDEDKEVVQLTATDGLNRLESRTFDDLSITAKQSVKYILSKILESLPTAAFWGADDLFLSMATEWVENGTVSGQHMDNTKINPKIFRSYNNGEYEYKSILECLKIICLRFYCRIKLSNGYWQYTQIPVYDAANYAIWKYPKTGGTAIGSGTAPNDIIFDQSDLARSEVEFEMYAPIKKVISVYRYKSTEDDESQGMNYVGFLPENYVVPVNSATGLWQEIGEVTSGTYLNFWLSFLIDFVSSGNKLQDSGATPYDYFFVKLLIYFKVVGSSSTEYAKGYNNIYTDYNTIIEWNTTSTNYLFLNGFYRKSDISLYSDSMAVGFTIQEAIPFDGTLSMKIEALIYAYEGTFSYDHALLLGTSTLVLTLRECQIATLESVGGALVPASGTVKYIAENEVSGSLVDSEIVELDELPIGDGIYQQCISALIVGSGITDVWQIGGTGTTYALGELLVNAILASYEKPLKILKGKLYHRSQPSLSFDFACRFAITYDGNSEYYIINGGEYDSVQQCWTVEAIMVQTFKSFSVAIPTPVHVRPPKSFRLPEHNYSPKPPDLFSPLISYIPGDIVLYEGTDNNRLALATTANDGTFSESEWKPAETTRILKKDNDYTLKLFDQVILCDGTSRGFNVAILRAADCEGYPYTFKLINATNPVTLANDGTETTDGVHDYTLSTLNEGVVIISDGTEFWIIHKF